MASILEVEEIVTRMADGFENAVMDYLEYNSDIAEDSVREQLYSGQEGDGSFITPDYRDDPFFDEPGQWHGRNEAYINFKNEITPPVRSVMLGLPPRPEHVPNLYITGIFHSEIFARRDGNVFRIDAAGSLGSDIAAKYGDMILRLGPVAVRYINDNILMPGIWHFFGECGY